MTERLESAPGSGCAERAGRLRWRESVETQILNPGAWVLAIRSASAVEGQARAGADAASIFAPGFLGRARAQMAL